MSPKVVLVTGCSNGGIGFYLCERFAEQGCTVYATSRRLETMDGLKHPIEKRVMDVTSDDDVKLVVQSILEEQGKIDIVVNNAGAISVGPLLDVSLDQARKAFETNTYSILRVAQAVAPSMVERKLGLIVNIGSLVGNIPTPWNGLYCAAKAAVRAFTDVLTMECKPFGVKVMLVAPGQVRSNITANQAATLELSSTSIYEPYFDRMYDLLRGGQAKGNMPTDEFARRVVAKVLSPNPPSYMSLGGKSGLFEFFCWLPRWLVLWILGSWMVWEKTEHDTGTADHLDD
ncbi:NAD(P)-binding protein [Suillus brevipes Sb2]|nr:NAD(P)-binding protein [Suillus brevipes Sb2]